MTSEPADGYKAYLKKSLDDLHSVLVEMACRPILFVGSGMTIRYLGGPSWEGLLQHLIEANPSLDRPYNFYYQRAEQSLPRVATLLETAYQDKAWAEYKTTALPKELFDKGTQPSVFLKYEVAQYFDGLLQKYLTSSDASPYNLEIEAFRKVQPHAIITTNYDQFLERVFPDFDPIVAQRIIRKPPYSDIGDILKIHGCTTDFKSIVISEADYTDFETRKKYLTAKLLTYFIEYPLIFMGYSVTDSNIKAILSDIAEMVPSSPDDVVKNIWFIRWQSNINANHNPPTEKVIDLGGGNSIRVRYILLSEFGELYRTLARPFAVSKINVKLLRNLAANVYKIVREKTASSDVEVNLTTFSQLSDEDKLLNVLGFSDADPADALQGGYPFIISKLAEELGYSHWNSVQKLMDQVKVATSYDIKASNNEYHQATHYSKTPQHHYSKKALELLQHVKNGESYSVHLSNGKVIEISANAP